MYQFFEFYKPSDLQSAKTWILLKDFLFFLFTFIYAS